MKKSFIGAALAAGFTIFGISATAIAAPMNTPSVHAVVTPEPDVTVSPFTAPDTLQLHFAGARELNSDFAGGITVLRSDGGLMHYRPQAYQMINGKKKLVEVKFHIDSKDRATVEFVKIDKSAPVILKNGAIMSNFAANM